MTKEYADRLLPTMGTHISAFLKGYEDKLSKPEFNEDAIRILNERYFIKDDEGEVIESPEQFLARVALGVQYKDLTNIDMDDLDIESIYETAAEYYNLMATLSFLPGSPTLMNAGTPIGQMSACFVVPVEDSMTSIMDAVKSVALIHQSGGGTGMDFSRLRPKGALVGSTQGVASGPISFMKIFDATTEQIKQGGKRRGANMGMLRIDHPDILEFITCKDDDVSLQNFNISVAVTDEFMEALFYPDGEGSYAIKDPKTGAAIGLKKAADVWDMITKHAWNTGDPGIIFIDRVNADSPFDVKKYPEHVMHATNPCGEQPLEAYEACNLGSVNLVKFLMRDAGGAYNFDWPRLQYAVEKAVELLDNVVENSLFPMPEITEAVQNNRKIGLGVMGWADSLIELKVPYGSEASFDLALEVMSFIDDQATIASSKLAEVKGSFPSIAESSYDRPMRNAARTTIAPTGTISMLANGTSSGIEPVFAFAFTKKVMDGKKFLYVHPCLQDLWDRDIIDTTDIEVLTETGVWPEGVALPEYIVGAMDITPDAHIRMQAAFQTYVNNAVSKTVNLPNSASVEDVDQIYRDAYNTGCKGVTIYRDGSKSDQVLFTGSRSENGTPAEEGTVVIVRDDEAFDMVSQLIEDPQKFELVPIAEYEELTSATHKPAPRPEVMLGMTVRADTPCGTMYVTIDEDENGKPFEVFCKLGKSGACAGAVQETIGRLISMELRSGGDFDKLVKQLKGASCGQQVGFGPKRVTSCIDAIGLVLQNYRDGKYHDQVITETYDMSTDVEKPVDKPVDLPDGPGALLVNEGPDFLDIQVDKPHAVTRRNGACPECGSGSFEHEGGCAVCRSCGFSKCA